MAVEGGGAKVVLGSQMALRDPGQQVLVDDHPVGMVADGTAMGMRWTSGT